MPIPVTRNFSVPESNIFDVHIDLDHQQARELAAKITELIQIPNCCRIKLHATGHRSSSHVSVAWKPLNSQYWKYPDRKKEDK